VGAEPVAVTDCLNFGSPEKPDAYYQLAACIEGMAEACETLGTPVVSGNVSLYNETEAGAVYPTPVVGMVGVLADVRRHATPGFKREGDLVLLIGRFRPTLAGSEYLEVVHGKVAGAPPEPDLAREKEYADAVRSLVAEGIVDTAHDLSGGGLAVALAEMALGGGTGIVFQDGEIASKFAGVRGDAALFGEASGCLLVAVPEERLEDLQRALGEIPYGHIAWTGGDRFEIGEDVNVNLKELGEAYEHDFFL
jgi:phosphoribosylformylglycinamidine synthase subunit PurL